jgi:hypothetical protein
MDQSINDGGKGASRRKFLKLAGIAGMSVPFLSLDNLIVETVAIVTVSDGVDVVAASAPVVWAAGELEQALVSQGVTVNRYTRIADAKTAGVVIAVAGAGSRLAGSLLPASGVKIPAVPEALGLVPVQQNGRKVLLVCGQDERGLVYALLELADRVRHSDKALPALNVSTAVVEQPANGIRSLNRLFVSEVEDKPWYNDREMWPAYLTMLATQRFNRFNLSFGIGYDFLQKVTDAYFLFAYPFLFAVPGYDVKVPQLSDAERDANLAMLKYISEQTVARGLQFQLGLWMHGYEWLNTTNANYTIEGLHKENHAAYCRDAVRQLLQACPAISGITFRVHGESGVSEGSYAFWSTIFDGVKTCGRKVEIDMHAKGLDQSMIDAAVKTGMPVVLSPKYWAEHMGMPYHQADIRSLEIPHNNKEHASTLMALSAGSRSFLRYGYGDLLKTGRPYKILHRIWPGTQRLLLWGDPVTAAAHGRAFSFCGSDGVELMEPLSFKGRRGSGIAGDRCGYADAAYRPRWDWEKYVYTLRVFGRLIYNPDTRPAVWQRYWQKQVGAGAAAAEGALANVSRILPIVLTTHGASAGNNMYWPEIYTNQPITDPDLQNPYTDTPAPKTFGNVTPMDPQLFLSINDFVKERLSGERSGKYSPLEVAQWIEDYAGEAAKHLAEAASASSRKNKAEYRRMLTDVSIQIGLGRFFGAKFRAGVLFAVYEQSGDRTALEEALKMYRTSRQYWAGLADIARNVYVADITVGEHPWLRGHWSDRLPALDADVDSMARKLAEYKEGTETAVVTAKDAVREALGRPTRMAVNCRHEQPGSFARGQAVDLQFVFGQAPQSAILYYRHVSQAERYQKMEISLQGAKGQVRIPGEYTDSPYPLEYYVEVRHGRDVASIYPGFNTALAGQPYFVVKQVS